MSTSELTGSAAERAARPYDEVDLSSMDFWSATAQERERVFAVLRAERPVSWHRPAAEPLIEDPNDQGFWAVVRHADLIEVTKRHEDFLSGEGIMFDSVPQELLDGAQGFIAMDPPRHTKVRRLLTAAFTPKQIRRIDDQIRANARRVVDAIAAKGEADFATDVAALLPAYNIFDMVGVPEADRERILASSQFAGGMHDPEVMGGREVLPTLFESMLEQREYVGGLIAQRRENPTPDLLTALTQAEVDGERLTDMEIISFFGLLMVAGTDTTRQSLSHGMQALHDFPDQRAWLMADFDGRIAMAVEEMVRWATPIMTFRRTAARDCELAGQRITAGDKVVMFYASANWDTEVFDHPERLDLSRHPNHHISFGGGGIHHCLGGQLARQQIRALWDEVLHRLPDIHVSGELLPTRSNFFHGVNHLPVRFTPAR
ncbi:cytochrome P450 [Rhodococcus sp. X156]|uniref:cytochrome P450 n=1 Tax=Rhodococcus sp. X156 TaxID=2499145 RepID=UPI000FD92C73|nr:cytochrome P450 [Rhodococcus sp. X156]